MLTTDKYWDCECEWHYIHPKTCKKCVRCGTEQETQPDSMKVEVRIMNKVSTTNLGHICMIPGASHA